MLGFTLQEGERMLWPPQEGGNDARVPLRKWGRRRGQSQEGRQGFDARFPQGSSHLPRSKLLSSAQSSGAKS